MKYYRNIIVIFLLVFPCLVIADTGKYCSYLMDFGMSNKDTKTKQKEYSLRDCKKGDVIKMRITDSDKLNREAMYMAGEIAEICNNTLPVTIISENRAVCTYCGSRRQIRQPEK